ncbi:C39 family peptidase [Bacillus sp. 1NLA3E]|uniref:C39 family peptidase n=1 Tax=Bacillus sp. 1NLA3E TaxID=666686 RepID=UPI000247EF41|nr:C39 family peptidase [Bacillus sp. 1NLA3E]
MRKTCFVVILLPLLGYSHANFAESSHDNGIATKFKPIAQSPIIPSTQVNNSSSNQAKKFLLDVPLIKQNPELKYGCEVTSLTMMLQFAGVNTNKMELFSKIKKDPDAIQRSRSGDIIRWGNPNDGFVGDMTGKTAGYAVFDQPMEDLVNDYLPDRAVNLTNQSFDEVLKHVAHGYPVVVWTTGDFRLPDRPESWLHGNQIIHTPLDLHAVVLVGFDEKFVYINDPLAGKKQHAVDKQQFHTSWLALKSRAISYH